MLKGWRRRSGVEPWSSTLGPGSSPTPGGNRTSCPNASSRHAAAPQDRSAAPAPSTVQKRVAHTRAGSHSPGPLPLTPRAVEEQRGRLGGTRPEQGHGSGPGPSWPHPAPAGPPGSPGRSPPVFPAARAAPPRAHPLTLALGEGRRVNLRPRYPQVHRRLPGTARCQRASLGELGNQNPGQGPTSPARVASPRRGAAQCTPSPGAGTRSTTCRGRPDACWPSRPQSTLTSDRTHSGPPGHST